MWFIKLCVNRPVFVVMIESLLLILGLIGYAKIGVDLYPKIDPPVITVTVNYPGAGPEEIETLVAKPIEDTVNQIGGIKRLSSTSQQGVGRVIVEFELEVDAKEAQNDVRDKVARARDKLPLDIEEPVIERVDFEDRPISTIALTAESTASYSDAALRIYADNDLKPRLQKVNGIGQISIFGGREREVEILLDRPKLQAFNLSVSDVERGLRAANVNTPSGDVNERGNQRSIRVLGEYSSPSEISSSIVTTLKSGRVVRVKDIATVRDGLKDQKTLARVDGKNVVMIEVKKQSDANTVDVAENVQKAAEALGKTLPRGLKLTMIYDGAKMIRNSVHDVIETIEIAAVLAVIVVYFFLGSFQSTLITGLALPCTIIASFFALRLAGFTLNIMTLLGISLSVGLILDDAIVIRENIWNKIEQGLDAKTAAVEGTREVIVAVLATSLTVLAVFFPVTFIPGVVGRFFAAFAFTVCIGIIMSTFDAVTMAPMLSANLMRATHSKDGHVAKRNFALRFTEYMGGGVAVAYAWLLDRCLRHPAKTLIVAVAIFVGSIALLGKVGFTFLPDDESGEFEVAIEAPPGTSFEAMTTIAGGVETLLKSDVPEMVTSSTEVGTEFEETNKAVFYVKLKPYGERERTTSQVKNSVRIHMRPLIDTYKLALTVRNAGGGARNGKAVTAVVTGQDNLVLQKLSAQIIETVTSKIPGIANMESNLKPGREELQLKVQGDNASAFGLSARVIGENVRGIFEGVKAGVYREAGEEYDIRVRFRDDQRVDTLVLNDLTIPNDRGEAVPLSAVVTPLQGTSPTSIIRIDQKRAARIDGDLLPGAALATVLKDMKAIVEPMLPTGYTLSFQGQAESLADLRVGAIGALALGAIFIYMVMASLYESFVLPFSILLSLPLAMVGAIAALFLCGKLLDIYSVIGTILLMALVTKNAILLVDYAEQLQNEGKSRDVALREACLRRMRPIVMTSVAMIAGMLPVAIGMGELNKVRAGMGVVTIGGLASSTLLSLIVVPCAYLFLDRFRKWSQRLVSRYYFKEA